MTRNLFTSVFAALLFACPSFALVVKRDASIQWVDCASSVPEPLKGMQLPPSLPPTLQCGRLDVHMDYSQPLGPNNTITLGFSMNRPQNPQGLINFNPGGPNAEVASFAWQMALNVSEGVAFTGLEAYDFLAMDVRGTFSSNPVNCTIGNWTVPSSFPSNEAEFQAYQASAATFAQSCIDQSAPKGIIAHLSTADTIQDWDSVRKALGYDKLHFFGVSYGTAGGAAYANKFPQNVGRFVLDAIFPPGISNVDVIGFQMQAVNRLLLRADAFCIFDDTCPFHSQGKGSVVKAFGDVLGLTNSGNSSNTTADDVRAMVTMAYLSNNPNFSVLNEALFGALNGNWTGLSYAAFGPAYTQAFVVVLPTVCLDQHIDDNTFAGFDKIRKTIASNDTADIQYSQDLSLIGLCGGWPYTAKSSEKLPVNASMLLVTADFDLNTPTESSTFEWLQATNSSLVVRHGDNHGTFTVPGPARSAEFDFLTTGNPPQATNQTLVSIFQPGSTRDAVADPYTAPIGPPAGDVTQPPASGDSSSANASSANTPSTNTSSTSASNSSSGSSTASGSESSTGVSSASASESSTNTSSTNNLASMGIPSTVLYNVYIIFPSLILALTLAQIAEA